MTLVMPPATRGTKTSKRGCSSADTISAATSSGSTFFTPRADCRPDASSVFTTPGITQENSMGVSRSSARTASVTPTTKCLVPQ